MSHSVELNGKTYSIPRINPYSAKAEPIRAELLDLSHTIKGGLIPNLSIREAKNETAIARLEMMIERADLVIRDEKTPEDKRDKYFLKIEEYERDLRAREEDLKQATKEAYEALERIEASAVRCATHVLMLPPLSLSEEEIGEFLDMDAAMKVVHAVLGLTVSKDEEKGGGTSLDGPPLTEPSPSTPGDGQ